MSFSAEWLALREMADHRARDPGLLAKLAEWAHPRGDLTIADLGCGTGSNARAMIPHLAGTQHWRLIDNDGTLLGLAKERLAAESAHHLRAITIKTEEADLAQDLATISPIAIWSPPRRCSISYRGDGWTGSSPRSPSAACRSIPR